MARIVKNDAPKKVDGFAIEQFNHAENEEEPLKVASSIQNNSIFNEEMHSSSIISTNSKGSEIVQPAVFKEFDPSEAAPLKRVSISKESFLALNEEAEEEDDLFSLPHTSHLFSSYEPDEEEEALLARIKGQSAAAGEESSGEAEKPEFQQVNITENMVQAEDVKLLESQRELLEANNALEEAKASLENAHEKIGTLSSEIEALKAQIQEMQEKLPEEKEASRQEGIQEGVQQEQAKTRKQYEAEKQDYLGMLEKNWNQAHMEISKIQETLQTIDEQMPEVVVAYLRELVGAERKLNDKLVVNIIHSALNRIKDLQNVVFQVNPEDADVVAGKYPQYEVTVDPGIPKGGVRMHTRLGDIDLSLDSWMESLEKQINEQFTATKNDKTL